MDRVAGGARMSRRRFLALSGAGLAAVGFLGASGAGAVFAEDAPDIGATRFVYGGSGVEILPEPEPRIVIDGEALPVVSSNGAYRTGALAYSPERTLEDLARRVVDHRSRMMGRM